MKSCGVCKRKVCELDQLTYKISDKNVFRTKVRCVECLKCNFCNSTEEIYKCNNCEKFACKTHNKYSHGNVTCFDCTPKTFICDCNRNNLCQVECEFCKKDMCYDCAIYHGKDEDWDIYYCKVCSTLKKN